MIDTIFFDFDGVILDSVDAKTEAFYSMYLKYGLDFAEKVKQFHISNGGVSRFEKFKIWNGDWLGESLSDADIDSLSKEFSRLSLEKVKNSPYVLGSKNFIESNHGDYNFFIITGSAQDDIDKTIDFLGIRKYFVEVCGSPKTKIQWGQELIDRHSLKPKHILFIGDARTDKEAALKLQTKFCLRQTADNQNLIEGSDIVIRDFTELSLKNKDI